MKGSRPHGLERCWIRLRSDLRFKRLPFYKERSEYLFPHDRDSDGRLRNCEVCGYTILLLDKYLGDDKGVVKLCAGPLCSDSSNEIRSGRHALTFRRGNDSLYARVTGLFRKLKPAMKKKLILFSLVLLSCGTSYRAAAQYYGVRVNALALATGTLNAGFETSLGDKYTLDLSAY